MSCSAEATTENPSMTRLLASAYMLNQSRRRFALSLWEFSILQVS